MSSDPIIHQFNCLRAEQRQLSLKVAELETDLTEHKLVSEALSEVNDASRVCYRMIGGVLVQRTVEEVIPSLQNNKQMIETLIEALKKQIVSKGVEITRFVEKNNIQIRTREQQQESRETNPDSNSVLVE